MSLSEFLVSITSFIGRASAALPLMSLDVPGNVGNGGIPAAAAAAFAGAAAYGWTAPSDVDDGELRDPLAQDVNTKYQDAFGDLTKHQESYRNEHPPAQAPPATPTSAVDQAMDTFWESFWTMGGKVPR